ncbi:aldolase/citrate lyase family protein [Ruegeria sp. 2205SS24-7]|uniref:HpcH/HpaI aldolase family protein n=1 Tax=Ruegeria discodermiae TaxID=3064389 RepID=UPI0027421F0D|nr:aldolase/citrate lyase family protein [Ruegeria sp. 2205SS24-7]MDP5216099.1 aldolase/citrate lyase family protein [Ruegeria sp. 2205SS24-7]
MPSLKQKLGDPARRLTSALCTIPSAIVTQAMAAAGMDFVMIDMEHGAVDHGSCHAMIAATAGSDCAPLVRVAENDTAQVKRVLDMGAEGIVFPLIRDAEDARAAVASLRYPPRGTRGFGPFIAHSRWGTSLMDYRETIEDQLICCLLIETAEAVENIDAICAVEGIDLLVVAAFDLSTSLGVSGQFDHPDYMRAQQRVEEAALRAGLPLGGAALNATQAAALFERGHRVIAGFDVLWLKQQTAEMASWCAD